MGNALITVNSDFCEDGCELTPTIDWTLFGIFVLIVIGIWNVCYNYRKKHCHRKTNQNDECFLRHDDKIMNSPNVVETYFPFIVPIIPRKQVKIGRNICLSITLKFVDIYAVPTIKINKPVEEVFPLFEERKLICYCDGSYSHPMRIGHSGFRASNGANRVRCFSPHDPKYGSTNTEVLAAYLAIQYALEKHYNTLIIYTDNSKVEQLLKRPKKKDNINHPNICQILHQYQKQHGNNTIQVVRVRGHTSKDEQQKCKIKSEFAKTDRMVRKKTRQYRKRWWINFEQTYYCWYKHYHCSYDTWRVLGYYI